MYKLSQKFAGMKPSATREILKVTSQPGMIAFAGGSPAIAAFPCEEVKKVSAEILNEDPVSALVYGVSEGYDPLRKTVKEWLKERENVGTDDDSVIIPAGGTQVMDIATRILAEFAPSTQVVEVLMDSLFTLFLVHVAIAIVA